MWDWKKSAEKAEVSNLLIENSNLKQTIALARKLESDLRAANAYETEIWQKRCSEYKTKINDLEFEVMTLKGSTKRKFLESTLEKLQNVSNKLVAAEHRIKDLESQVAEMQKFIDTLPDGFRGAWSLYLMTKKDEDKDLVENSETVASFLIELKDEYAGYSVSICDMDGNEHMHFILEQETDFDYLSSIGYKEVLNSKIFAWKIYDEDDGEEEIYIEIEE